MNLFGSYDEILNKKFNFVKKSKKDKEVLEDCNNDDEVWDTIKVQLGKDFPANPNIFEKNATNNEQFPEDLFTM